MVHVGVEAVGLAEAVLLDGAGLVVRRALGLGAGIELVGLGAGTLGLGRGLTSTGLLLLLATALVAASERSSPAR